MPATPDGHDVTLKLKDSDAALKLRSRPCLLACRAHLTFSNCTYGDKPSDKACNVVMQYLWHKLFAHALVARHSDVAAHCIDKEH